MFSKDLKPKDLSLSAVVVGGILADELTASELNALGNWFMLVGQYLETIASFQSFKETKLQNININTNTKKYQQTNNPFSIYDNSNYILRQEIETIKKNYHNDN